MALPGSPECGSFHRQGKVFLSPPGWAEGPCQILCLGKVCGATAVPERAPFLNGLLQAPQEAAAGVPVQEFILWQKSGEPGQASLVAFTVAVGGICWRKIKVKQPATETSPNAAGSEALISTGTCATTDKYIVLQGYLRDAPKGGSIEPPCSQAVYPRKSTPGDQQQGRRIFFPCREPDAQLPSNSNSPRSQAKRGCSSPTWKCQGLHLGPSV